MAARDRMGEIRTGNTVYNNNGNNNSNSSRRDQQPQGSGDREYRGGDNNNNNNNNNNSYQMNSRSNGNGNGNGNNAGNGFSSQISSLLSSIDRIESNVTAIARFHERALVGVSQDETNRITRQLDELQDETNGLMDNVRTSLKRLSDETKRMGGGGEAQSRKAQQSSAAMKLQNAAQRYSQVQKFAKEQYKKRMVREIKIARPDVSEQDVQRAVNDSNSGSAFAQEMLNSRIGAQRRVLQEVQGRHEELRKMESSIEELATLFMDLQVLLETQQNQIDGIETQVEYTVQHIEDGGREIKRAISIRKSSRRKLWYIAVGVVVIILILAAVCYIQRCAWFQIQCQHS